MASTFELNKKLYKVNGCGDNVLLLLMFMQLQCESIKEY